MTRAHGRALVEMEIGSHEGGDVCTTTRLQIVDVRLQSTALP
jgi:hypothetical protein